MNWMHIDKYEKAFLENGYLYQGQSPVDDDVSEYQKQFDHSLYIRLQLDLDKREWGLSIGAYRLIQTDDEIRQVQKAFETMKDDRDKIRAALKGD